MSASLRKIYNCVVEFFHTHSEFHELDSGKRTSIVRGVNGLYYFEDDAALEGQAQVVKKTSSQSSVDEIMLWYCKLGHSSFLYLQKSPLYKCKICESSKHQ